MTKPIQTLKDGLISAAIWKNSDSDGKSRYSVTFTRSYLKDEQWFESTSFSGNELLRLSNLAERAYRFIGAERAKARTASAERAA